MSQNNYDIGKVGQDKIRDFYINHNYTLLIENYQAYTTRKIGEVDLIFSKLIDGQNILALVEVKTRNSSKFGTGLEQITKPKLRAMYNSYLHFVSKNRGFGDYFVRIDVASVDSGKITIIPNCYDFSGI
jgi:putative endonuclease